MVGILHVELYYIKFTFNVRNGLFFTMFFARISGVTQAHDYLKLTRG